MKVLVLLLVFCSLQASLAGLSPCKCTWQPTQVLYCKADFAIRGRVISTEKVYHSTGQRSPQIEIAVKYLVRVKRIFKGEELMHEEDVEIMTPPSETLCGVTYLEVDTSYLLTGSLWKGDLRIGFCDWIQKYDDLDSSMREALKTTYNNCDI